VYKNVLSAYSALDTNVGAIEIVLSDEMIARIKKVAQIIADKDFKSVNIGLDVKSKIHPLSDYNEETDERKELEKELPYAPLLKVNENEVTPLVFDHEADVKGDAIEIKDLEVDANNVPSKFYGVVAAKLQNVWLDINIETCALRVSIEPDGIDLIAKAVKWLQDNADACDSVILELVKESDITPLMRLEDVEGDKANLEVVGFEDEELVVDGEHYGEGCYFKVFRTGEVVPTIVLDEGDIRPTHGFMLSDILKKVESKGVATNG
jgi:hypothetical protein